MRGGPSYIGEYTYQTKVHTDQKNTTTLMHVYLRRKKGTAMQVSNTNMYNATANANM